METGAGSDDERRKLREFIRGIAQAITSGNPDFHIIQAATADQIEQRDEVRSGLWLRTAHDCY